MHQKFIDHFSKISPLSKEEADAIRDNMIVKTFKKGSHLLKEGQISIDTYFVLKGCIREYILTDGEEKTTNFFTEDQWVISLNSFTPQQPTSHNLVCVEDSTVSIGNEEQAQVLFKQFPRFETISRAVMEAFFIEQKKQLTSFLTETPEQRYLNLVNARPDLVQRVPQYQLASYVGIKPESLSRIRKRMTQKP